MRIVHYNDTYEKVGGTETYCSSVLTQLQAMGHETYWLAHGDGAIKSPNHILLAPSKGTFQGLRSKYFFDQKKYLAIKTELAKIQPDVLHLHHNRYHTYELFQALTE